jgi:hypothetical protein
MFNLVKFWFNNAQLCMSSPQFIVKQILFVSTRWQNLFLFISSIFLSLEAKKDYFSSFFKSYFPKSDNE